MKSIIKTNHPEVGHGIAIFDPTKREAKVRKRRWKVIDRNKKAGGID